MIREKTETSMDLYMKRMRISGDKAKTERKIPLLIGDETGKDMPYTKEATIRTHQERIRNLLKLVDYLVITSKTELIIGMVNYLTTVVRDITVSYDSEKKSFISNTWIIVDVREYEGSLLFSPDEQHFLEELEDIIMGTLTEVCGRHSQLLHLPDFD